MNNGHMRTPCGQTVRHDWKHYLPGTSLAGGKNLVAIIIDWCVKSQHFYLLSQLICSLQIKVLHNECKLVRKLVGFFRQTADLLLFQIWPPWTDPRTRPPSRIELSHEEHRHFVWTSDLATTNHPHPHFFRRSLQRLQLLPKGYHFASIEIWSS